MEALKLAQQQGALAVAALKKLFIMTPLDHAWHHGEKLNPNFGANLNLFDKLHGSFSRHEAYPDKLGVRHRLTPWQQLLFPFRAWP